MTDSLETGEGEAVEVPLAALVPKLNHDRVHADFEHWYLSAGGHPNNLRRDGHGGYVYAQREWEVWQGNAAEVMALRAKVEELEEELRITDQLLEARNQVLRAITPCRAHGDQCIPHALDWIDEAKLAERKTI